MSVAVLRRLRVPEVLQASTMDCGPASLAALLVGHGIAADAGRLREACQTDIDGTSIDRLEDSLNALGLRAEQAMLPADRLLPDRAGAALPSSLPCLAVTRLVDGAPHFVVLWNRAGPFVQVMDPAEGRRWLRASRLRAQLFPHSHSVPASDWLDWARSDENLASLRAGLASLRLAPAETAAILDRAAAAPLWFPLAAVEACLRLVSGLADDRRLTPAEAGRLFVSLLEATLTSEHDIYSLVPQELWSVTPDPDSHRHGERRLLLRGAVFVRITGRGPRASDLTPELAAAVGAPKARLRASELLRMAGGRAAAVLLVAATLIALAGALAEALFLRAIVGMPEDPQVRSALTSGLIALMLGLILLRLALGAGALASGRRLDLRLRTALLEKLNRLPDRYHESRPLADMAERAHSLHHVRGVPGHVLGAIQAAGEVIVITAGLSILLADQALLVLLAAVLAIGLPLVTAPLLADREIGLRARRAALGSVLLDAMRGQAPLRAHRAERTLRVAHEAQLVGWARAHRGLNLAAALLGAVQRSGPLVAVAFLAAGAAPDGALDPLVLWWLLKLPDSGADFAGQIRQGPALQAVLRRLSEPLSAADRPEPRLAPALAARQGGVAVNIAGGSVMVSGRQVLADLDLSIAAGEHVAVIGPSGSGKSSLVALLLGFNRLAAGSLQIDGLPLDDTGLAALRPRMAWVDPTVALWRGSLHDNLTFARPEASEAAILDAARLSGMGRIAQRRALGLLSPAGAEGRLLSGGEGQRLRLARALLQEAPLLALLDEPFRGLEAEARRQLLAETRSRWRDSTLIWVTHDIAEAAQFGRVLVIEDGRIAEDGAPADLLACDSHLARLMRAQTQTDAALWGGSEWRRLRVEGGRVQPVA